MFASMHRLLYHVAPVDSWGVVFSDDSVWMLPLRAYWLETTVVLLTATALGFPIPWKKTRCGLDVLWVGFVADLKRWTIGISLSRQYILRGLVAELLRHSTVDAGRLQSVVGSLGFAFQILVQLKPFLHPLYSLLSSVEGNALVAWPRGVRAILHFIDDQLQKSVTRSVSGPRRELSEMVYTAASAGSVDVVVTPEEGRVLSSALRGGRLSSDLVVQGWRVPAGAKVRHWNRKRGRRSQGHAGLAAALEDALGDIAISFTGRVGIGGWWGGPGCEIHEATWFMEEITESNVPWAFVKCADASRCIAPLELLASVIAWELRRAETEGIDSSVCVSGVTDNSGNSFVVSKMYTAKLLELGC